MQLYDQKPYETEFQAVVVSCEQQENSWAVVLDQTLFFPEEGGQTPDRGTIDGIPVIDVQIKDQVIHYLKSPFAVGTRVNGKIDWMHRFYNMQQHSGEHIFSGLVHEKYGFDNVGFHLSDQIVSMDFNGVMTAEQVEEIEYRANEVITSNIEIGISYPSKEELDNLMYRSKIKLEGEVRIVTIPGVDICACCAPHVKRTGEIGLLKVVSLQNYKGGVRICILCGFRALMDYRMKQKELVQSANYFSVGLTDVYDTILRERDKLTAAKQEAAALKNELVTKRINELPAELLHVCLFEGQMDTITIRNAVNLLTERYEGYCALFSGSDEEGYQYIVGSKELDCRELQKLMKENLQARGGGKPEMIQGSVKISSDAVKKLFAGLEKE